MTKQELETHRTHCCICHGCKYCSKNCPVVKEKITQAYLCEDCYSDELDDVNQAIALAKGCASKPFLRELVERVKKYDGSDNLENFVRRLHIEAELKCPI